MILDEIPQEDPPESRRLWTWFGWFWGSFLFPNYSVNGWKWRGSWDSQGLVDVDSTHLLLFVWKNCTSLTPTSSPATITTAMTTTERTPPAPKAAAATTLKGTVSKFSTLNIILIVWHDMTLQIQGVTNTSTLATNGWAAKIGRIRRMESLNDAFNLKCAWSMLKSQDRFHRYDPQHQ